MTSYHQHSASPAGHAPKSINLKKVASTSN